MNKKFTIGQMFVFLLAFLTGNIVEAQLLQRDPPGHPEHWKGRAEPEKKYSITNEKWIVDFAFTNVSQQTDQLMTSNDYFMYRVTAVRIDDKGAQIGLVKNRIFSQFPMQPRYTQADPGKIVWTVCDIRAWLVINQPGWYKIQVGRMLNMKDADDNAVGEPVKNLIKVPPFKIFVAR